MAEKSVMVGFEGYRIDIFICDDGQPGITIEKENTEGKSVDIFYKIKEDKPIIISSIGCERCKVS